MRVGGGGDGDGDSDDDDDDINIINNCSDDDHNNATKPLPIILDAA